MKKKICERIIYFMWHSIILIPCFCYIFFSDTINKAIFPDKYWHNKTEISRCSIDTEQYDIKGKNGRSQQTGRFIKNICKK